MKHITLAAKTASSRFYMCGKLSTYPGIRSCTELSTVLHPGYNNQKTRNFEKGLNHLYEMQSALSCKKCWQDEVALWLCGGLHSQSPPGQSFLFFPLNLCSRALSCHLACDKNWKEGRKVRKLNEKDTISAWLLHDLEQVFISKH